jgi:hypothetical protein
LATCRSCNGKGHSAKNCQKRADLIRPKISEQKSFPRENIAAVNKQIWREKKPRTEITALQDLFPLAQATVSSSVLGDSPSVQGGGAMANFPVNPLAFLPEGMTIDQGPADRKVRSHLVVHPISPLQHDNVIIAEPSRFIPIQFREDMREEIANMITEAGFTVTAFDDHPLGLGVFTMIDTLAADGVVGTNFQLDEDTVVTFVKHDQARNMRLTTFGREIRVLFLGFPLDYQSSYYVSRACDDFGLLSEWYQPRANKKFVLVKVQIVDPKFVPKSLVIQQLGGPRRSWGIPVIMLRSADWNAHHDHIPPPPEDPAPDNGNPHPLHGVEVTAEQIYQNQLNIWLQ